jgi:hypothetical protein
VSIFTTGRFSKDLVRTEAKKYKSLPLAVSQKTLIEEKQKSINLYQMQVLKKPC